MNDRGEKVEIPCGAGRHVLRFSRKGHLTLLDHDARVATAEAALGGENPPCVVCYTRWQQKLVKETDFPVALLARVRRRLLLHKARAATRHSGNDPLNIPLHLKWVRRLRMIVHEAWPLCTAYRFVLTPAVSVSTSVDHAAVYHYCSQPGPHAVSRFQLIASLETWRLWIGLLVTHGHYVVAPVAAAPGRYRVLRQLNDHDCAVRVADLRAGGWDWVEEPPDLTTITP